VKREPATQSHRPRSAVKVKAEASDPSLLAARHIQPAPAAPQLNQIYSTIGAAVNAVLTQQRRLGHIWRKGQSKQGDGGLKKLTLRCNHYSTHVPCHLSTVDPSDHRKGRSIKTNCFAHVNINRVRETGDFRITFIDCTHNHPPEIPEGGEARSRPTEEQKALIKELATTTGQSFSRSQIGQVLKASSGKPLEPRQITNVMNESRKEAREETRSLGGDFQAI
ncbi:hypothetical protein FA13DRAFT_1580842, partial [Coprinellus micaceus]